jgi:hypothetical protein
MVIFHSQNPGAQPYKPAQGQELIHSRMACLYRRVPALLSKQNDRTLREALSREHHAAHGRAYMSAQAPGPAP